MELYRACCDMIIRPPRDEYDDTDLGSKEFVICGRKYERTDVELQNSRELKIVCSHWCPASSSAQKIPCIIYLHGNCGSRLDAMDCLEVAAVYGLSLFALDFAGAGHSEGDYISLGFHEQNDVEAVVEYLLHTQKISSICLWGRSMGAATSVLFAARNRYPELVCLVLDSPFASLKEIATEVGGSVELDLPRVLVTNAVHVGLSFVRRTIKSRAKFDINKVAPVAVASKCTIPAIFFHGNDDTFIAPRHSADIYAVYGGPKELILVPGDHNSARNGLYYTEASRFIYMNLIDLPFKELLALSSPALPSQMKEKYFFCKMLRSGIPGPPFNVILVVSAAHGIVLHAPFTSEIAEIIPYGRIRAYGARDENFIMKWADEGCTFDDSIANDAEVDDPAALVEAEKNGIHFVTFFTAEAPQILESIESVIEGLLSSKMGVDNIDNIIEEVVREKEKAGRPFTKEEILESIDDLVMKKKLDPDMLSESSNMEVLSSEKPSCSSEDPSSPNAKRKSVRKKKGKRKSRKIDDKGKEEEEVE